MVRCVCYYDAPVDDATSSGAPDLAPAVSLSNIQINNFGGLPVFFVVFFLLFHKLYFLGFKDVLR